MELTLYGVNLWAALVLFARIGAVIVLLPGFGEPAVPGLVRLAIAGSLTVMLAPSLAGLAPPPPADPWLAGGVIIKEALIGLFLGAMARLIFAALATAGQVIGFETGLSFAQANDPTMGQAGQLFSVFLAVLGVALVFAANLHHLFLEGVYRSYSTFPPGDALPVADAAAMAVDVVGRSFAIGVQLAAPLILAGLVFRLGLGVLSRLIPNIQVFFVAMPFSVLGALVVFALGLSAGMIVWLDRLQEQAATFP